MRKEGGLNRRLDKDFSSIFVSEDLPGTDWLILENGKRLKRYGALFQRFGVLFPRYSVFFSPGNNVGRPLGKVHKKIISLL